MTQRTAIFRGMQLVSPCFVPAPGSVFELLAQSIYSATQLFQW